MLRLHVLGGLWIERDDGSTTLGPRPRRLALLAIVAAAGRKGATREQVLGILWPGSGTELARHSLSQTLYSLRRDLGCSPVVADGQVLRLDPAIMSCDLVDLRTAVAERAWDRAADLYAGSFLDGFYLDATPDFERWAEAERARVQDDAMRAVSEAARTAALPMDAARYSLMLTHMDPLSAKHAVAYMEAIATAGEPARALSHARQYQARVASELGTAPDPRVTELARRLRETGHAVSAITRPPSAPPLAASPAAPAPQSPVGAAAPPTNASAASGYGRGRHRITWRSGLAIGGAVLSMLVATYLYRRGAERRVPDAPVLAVGTVRDLASPDSALAGGILADMLTTSLGRLADVQVIATTRLLELLPRDPGNAPVARSRAAARAGATQVLEGELVRQPRGGFALDLRRVDLRSGRVRRGYRVTGSDRVAIVDSVTSLVAADLGLKLVSGSLATVSTASPIAYRLYDSGLRSWYRGDAEGAHGFFEAATQDDSTFAMAAYYLWLSGRALELPVEPLAARVKRLALRANDRDRLVILTHLDQQTDDPASLVYADSLARRFPTDPEALLRAAEALVNADPARTIALLNRAIAIDSAASSSGRGICRLCSSFSTLHAVYVWADSADGIARTLERWQRLAPTDPMLWRARGDFLLRTRGWEASQDAFRRGDSLLRTDARTPSEAMLRMLVAEQYDRAEQVCGGAAVVPPDERANLRWYCVILLRTRGQYADALRLLDGGTWRGALIYGGLPADPFSRAAIALETGDGRQAAAGFETLARQWASRPPSGLRARNIAWNLTLAATARVAAGDTAGILPLADSVQRIGAASAFVRDGRLHFFIRGLLAAHAGRHAEAVALFRQAESSPTFGFTRINYELAHSLLALGRPREAIGPLEAVLRGGIDGSNTYLTRTETHELLAQAFAAAGMRDSAVVQYGAVVTAWAHADPILAARVATARAFVAAGLARR